MAALVIAWGAVTSLLAVVVTVLTIREKLRPAKPHPLAAPLAAGLADIAAALREAGR